MSWRSKWHLLTSLLLAYLGFRDNPELLISGDGQDGLIIAGGHMNLTCKQHGKGEELFRVEWMKTEDGGNHTIMASYWLDEDDDDDDQNCGEGDHYEDRATCMESDQDDHAYILSLSNVEYDLDNGKYTCVTYYNETETSPESEEVYGSVHVEIQLGDTQFTEPEDPLAPSVEFTCSTNQAKPKGKITWSYDGDEEEDEKDEEVCSVDDEEYCSVSSILTLQGHRDGHQVTCTITQEEPFSDTLHTHQYVFQSVALSTAINSSTELEAGQTLQLTCDHTYQDEDFNSVQWVRQERVVASYNTTCHLHPEYDDREVDCERTDAGRHTFTVESTVEGDSGTYQCLLDVITSEYDHLSNTLEVNVADSGAGGRAAAAVYHSMWIMACVMSLMLQ